MIYKSGFSNFIRNILFSFKGRRGDRMFHDLYEMQRVGLPLGFTLGGKKVAKSFPTLEVLPISKEMSLRKIINATRPRIRTAVG